MQQQPSTRPTPTLIRSPWIWLPIVYGAVFAALPWDGFWINDNGLKFIQLQAFLRNGTFDLAASWPGSAVDPEQRFFPIRPPFSLRAEGHIYASFSPFFAAISAGPFQLLGFAGLYLWPLIGGAFALLGCQRLAERLAPSAEDRGRTGRLAVWIAGLGSPVFFYSLSFWEHTPALALNVWALLRCADFLERPDVRRAALLGVFAALGIYLRSDSYLFAVVLGWLCIRGGPEARRLIPVVAAAGGSALAPLWLFHWLAVGHPLGTHIQAQGWVQLGLAEYLAQRVGAATHILANAHANAFWSGAIAFPYLALAAAGTRLRRLPNLSADALLWSGVGGVAVLIGHLQSQQAMPWLLVSNGLFAVSPILILGLVPGAATSRPRPAVEASTRKALLLHVGLYALLTPAMNAQGIHWGCRFILIAYPLLAALAAAHWSETFSRMRWGAPRALASGVLLLSILTQLYSIELLRARKQYSAALADQVSDRAPSFAVTDSWHLPQDLATHFHDLPLFRIARPEQLPVLLRQAERGGASDGLWLGSGRDLRLVEGEVERFSDGWLGFASVELAPLRIEDRPRLERRRRRTADN